MFKNKLRKRVRPLPASFSQTLIEEASKAIRVQRLKNKLTQQQMAEGADLDVKNIQRLEAGRGAPSLATLAKLRHVAGISVDQIIDSSIHA